MDQKGTHHPLAREARLAAYLDAIVGGLGHASRAASARAYCTGLLLPGECKSVEPMAARLDPAHVQAKHQSLHHVVAEAEWDGAALLAAVRAQVLPAVESGPRLDPNDDAAHPETAVRIGDDAVATLRRRRLRRTKPPRHRASAVKSP